MILKIHLDQGKPTRQYYQNMNEGITKKIFNFSKNPQNLELKVHFTTQMKNEKVGIETKE